MAAPLDAAPAAAALGETRTFNGRRAAEMVDALAQIIALAAGEAAAADGLLTAFVNRSLAHGNPEETVCALRVAIERIEILARRAAAEDGGR